MEHPVAAAILVAGVIRMTIDIDPVNGRIGRSAAAAEEVAP